MDRRPLTWVWHMRIRRRPGGEKKAPDEKGRAAFLDSTMRDFVGLAISSNGGNEMKSVATSTPGGDNPQSGNLSLWRFRVDQDSR
jgi:hypothetical protein